MQTFLEIIAAWFALSFAVPAFILWQRSPHFRDRVWRLVTGLGEDATNRRKNGTTIGLDEKPTSRSVAAPSDGDHPSDGSDGFQDQPCRRRYDDQPAPVGNSSGGFLHPYTAG